MPELRETFQMATGHVEPDRDSWLEQQQRQGGAKRNERNATLAVVVGIGLLLGVVWIFGTREGHTPRSPLGGPSTVGPNGADRVGLVGLAPEGAKPSLPTKGELVVGFSFGHTMGDPGRFQVFVYADGRLIWQRIGDRSTGAYSTGLLEQHLTPEGVELIRAEVISTGLFAHDRHLTSGQGLNYGLVDVRQGDLLVRVDWGDSGPDVAKETPTSGQASALQQLDARLEDPASWLPASAWEDPQIRPFVPSEYSVCYHSRKELSLSQVLGSLPPEAGALLLSHDRTQGQAPTFVYWCSHLTNEEARALARILDQAGLKAEDSEFGLLYGESGPTRVELDFAPVLPHEV